MTLEHSKYRIRWGITAAEAVGLESTLNIRDLSANVSGSDASFLDEGPDLRSFYSFKNVYDRLKLPTVFDDETGLPVSPETEFQVLLSYAAEIEHGLMVQYLYAAYSALDTGVASIIIDIAIEEMGHFLTVQNVLHAAGLEINVGRYDWNPDKVFQPFPFVLERLSRESLAKYCVAEMPDLIDVDQGEGEEADVIDEILRLAASATGVEPQRVGLLYMKIYWLLRPHDNDLGIPEPWHDYPIERVSADYAGRHLLQLSSANAYPQASRSDWQGNKSILIEVVGRSSDFEMRIDAMKAVSAITAEGEGPNKPSTNENGQQSPKAHFDQFVGLFRAATTGSLSKAVPSNPWYAGSPSGAGPPEAQISSGDAVIAARLADTLYEVILLEIALYFKSTSRPDAAKIIAETSLVLMRAGLATLASELTRLPLGNNPTSVSAAAICFSGPIHGKRYE